MDRSAKSHEKELREMHPLILLGMHRSGTSLTSRLLKEMGVYMGDQLSRDAEAIYFQKLNRRIFRDVGVKWGYVDPLLEAMNSDQFIDKQEKMVLKAMFGDGSSLGLRNGIADFFGTKIWSKILKNQPINWGWKDPRTTITFPIWLRVFNQAKFLHILRNGIDVAISTHRRSQKQQRKIWKRIFPLDYCPETLDFGYCFHLWEKYVLFVLKNKHLIPMNHFMEIRYEELLALPEVTLRRIADFIEFDIPDEVITTVCNQIDQRRLENTEYAKPYEMEIPSYATSPLMQKLDYQYSVENPSNIKML